MNFLLKLSDLKSNFTLTLGYLNPALNNPAQCCWMLHSFLTSSFRVASGVILTSIGKISLVVSYYDLLLSFSSEKT